MKWLEIIEVRAANSNRQELHTHLNNVMQEIENADDEQGIKAYRQFCVDTDFSMHLCHESPSANSVGSVLGLRLVSLLKQYGLVYHSIWVEMHNE